MERKFLQFLCILLCYRIVNIIFNNQNERENDIKKGRNRSKKTLTPSPRLTPRSQSNIGSELLNRRNLSNFYQNSFSSANLNNNNNNNNNFNNNNNNVNNNIENETNLLQTKLKLPKSEVIFSVLPCTLRKDKKKVFFSFNFFFLYIFYILIILFLCNFMIFFILLLLILLLLLLIILLLFISNDN